MLQEVLTIIVRTFGIYLAIYTVFRLMGKREIGELSILDLVIFIMLAEMAVLSIEQTEEPFWLMILPMFILLLIQRLTAVISLKSTKLRTLLDGTPSIIIRDGKIDEKVMKKQRYNMDDLLVQLREQGVVDLRDVELAILETTGKLSVFKKDDQPPTYFDPVILDGEPQEKALQQQGLTEETLKIELKNYGIQDLTKISIAQRFEDGSFFVDFKNN
ncbi:DUF421 domain-containing protein [Alkalibacillus aidingensis]|uniref:DUF421 domain-containing protein n=1 Tax=Alkalibacillus aidingensis TaxID=2747607 RepID=UPI0016615080|nr:DUF421 domain-containing protein [Alkalibacillus aidingensis]